MFSFLKEKLKQTVERFTKKVDEATEEVQLSEEEKKKALQEKKIKKKPVAKPKKIVDEAYGVEIEEQDKSEPEKKTDIKYAHTKKEQKEEIIHEKTKEKHEEKKKEINHKKIEEKIKEKKEEKKGFFAKLKEKFIHASVEEKKPVQEEIFHASSDELKEFEEVFKEIEQPHEKLEDSEKCDERIPVVTQTDTGETVFQMQEKPTAVGKKKKEETIEPYKEKIEKTEKKAEQKQEVYVEEPEQRRGFFGALSDTIFKTSLSEEKFEELFWEMEVILLENNVAVEVIELIKHNLKKELVEKKIIRGQINKIIIETLRDSLEQTFAVEQIDFIEKIKEKKPFVIVFVGINGSGKTTTIAKIAQKLKDNKLSCVMAAGDTFRAAAIQQLEEHANNLQVKLIKHDYGSDPAAVGFDAIKYAQAHNIDCVLIDTAGRLHSNTNLVDEMKKIIRVTKPDLKLFIGEAITGNDCVEQARKFNEAIGIDGIILAKADVDEKGGAALSVSYVTGKPILYLGTGQKYSDLEEFNSEKIIEQLGLA